MNHSFQDKNETFAITVHNNYWVSVCIVLIIHNYLQLLTIP